MIDTICDIGEDTLNLLYFVDDTRLSMPITEVQSLIRDLNVW